MSLSSSRNSNNGASTRGAVYIATFTTLLLAAIFLQRSTWLGTAQLHTLMEAIATLLSMLVGVLGLVRYYSRKENIFLFIGTGFIGNSFLEGYHALVSAPVFTEYFPSPPPSVVPWSGLAPRLFLSVWLWLSWAFWRRESRIGASARIPEYRVFFVVNTWTLACFLCFAILPLPPAYWSFPVFHRPQEIIPVFFCVLALAGYLQKGSWEHDPFEHALVLSIILLIVHSIYLSASSKLYDAAYIASHLLRLISYMCTLFGLIVAMYKLAREQESLLTSRTEELQREIAARKSAEETLRAARGSLNVSSVRISNPDRPR